MSIDPVVIEVLKLRSAATRITAGKLANALASVSRDGRLRDMAVYYGAHTGRFSGRKVQVQNLPRGLDPRAFNIEAFFSRGNLTWERLETYRQIAEYMREGLGDKKPTTGIADMISALIRPAFTAKEGHTLLVADYSAIELRGLAWVAGETELLESLSKGEDIYRKMASVLYEVSPDQISDEQRWVGKQIILGCGYQMSGSKFELMCANFGVNLRDVGVSGDECVEAYRASYPRIAGVVAGTYNDRPYRRGGVWHLFGDGVLACVDSGTAGNVGHCTIRKDGRHMVIELPSGRPIVYRNPRVELLRAKVAGKPVGDPKPTVVFEHPRGYSKVLFGGSITENVVQGISRDLLVDAMEQCELEGIPPVMHVHDEIVCEVPEAQASVKSQEMETIMRNPPQWAAGFPVDVKGYATRRYVKK